jgi:hypothetical protein
MIRRSEGLCGPLVGLEVGGHHLPRPSVVAASWCPFQGSSSRRTGLYLIRGHNSPVTRSPYLVGAPSRLARPLDGTGDYCPALCAPGAVRGVFASQVRPDGVQGCPLGVRFRLRIGQVDLAMGTASEPLSCSSLRRCGPSATSTHPVVTLVST